MSILESGKTELATLAAASSSTVVVTAITKYASFIPEWSSKGIIIVSFIAAIQVLRTNTKKNEKLDLENAILKQQIEREEFEFRRDRRKEDKVDAAD